MSSSLYCKLLKIDEYATFNDMSASGKCLKKTFLVAISIYKRRVFRKSLKSIVFIRFFTGSQLELNQSLTRNSPEII